MRLGLQIKLLAILLLAPVLLAALSPLEAGEANKLVERGNKRFEEGDYRGAIEYYDKASVEEPESPVIHFNRGGALFKSGDYQGAVDEFRKAASKTRDLQLEARAWYNMGNCSFMEGQRQADSDLEKALENYRESVMLYQTALEKDSTLADAALNMEVARLVIKDLLDKIKEQKEKMAEQREKMKEILDSLISLAGRQAQALEEGKKLADEEPVDSNEWREGVRKLEQSQGKIRKGTEEAKKKLSDLAGDQAPQPVQQAASHIDSSLAAQDEALEGLSENQPNIAAPGQEESLQQIRKAIESLSGEGTGRQGGQGDEGEKSRNQNQQPQEEPSQSKNQQEQAAKSPENETAMEILAEEKENREKRRQKARSGYRSVEKDW